MATWMKFLIGLWTVMFFVGFLLGMIGACFIVIDVSDINHIGRYEHPINILMASSLFPLLGSGMLCTLGEALKAMGLGAKNNLI